MITCKSISVILFCALAAGCAAPAVTPEPPAPPAAPPAAITLRPPLVDATRPTPVAPFQTVPGLKLER